VDQPPTTSTRGVGALVRRAGGGGPRRLSGKYDYPGSGKGDWAPAVGNVHQDSGSSDGRRVRVGRRGFERYDRASPGSSQDLLGGSPPPAGARSAGFDGRSHDDGRIARLGSRRRRLVEEACSANGEAQEASPRYFFSDPMPSTLISTPPKPRSPASERRSMRKSSAPASGRGRSSSMWSHHPFRWRCQSREEKRLKRPMGSSAW
jgi:hypothetical protein